MICRVCDSKRLELVLDLGMQPWGNHFLKKEELGKEPFYPLRLLYCLDCSTCQLDHTVPKEVMFSDHTYLSGVTRSLTEHFREVAEQVDQTFFAQQKQKSVLDIGSNDGTLLKQFQHLGYEVLGVESSKRVAQLANDQGVPTTHAFFNEALVNQLQRSFDVIHASGVFFHLEELHSVTRGIEQALKENGVFVVQFIYMQGMVENLAFDQIYHEHLLYYNLKNIQTLLRRHKLEVFDAYLSPIHGGSIVAYVGHPGKHPVTQRFRDAEALEAQKKSNEIETYHLFAQRVEKMKEENLQFFKAAKAQGKRIYGMGAPVKGNTLLNYFGVDSQSVEALVEKNPLRKGLYAPKSHLPIIMEEDVTTPPDIYYVLAWNFKKEILKNNQDLIRRGVQFYFPVDVPS